MSDRFEALVLTDKSNANIYNLRLSAILHVVNGILAGKRSFGYQPNDLSELIAASGISLDETVATRTSTFFKYPPQTIRNMLDCVADAYFVELDETSFFPDGKEALDNIGKIAAILGETNIDKYWKKNSAIGITRSAYLFNNWGVTQLNDLLDKYELGNAVPNAQEILSTLQSSVAAMKESGLTARQGRRYMGMPKREFWTNMMVAFAPHLSSNADMTFPFRRSAYQLYHRIYGSEAIACYDLFIQQAGYANALDAEEDFTKALAPFFEDILKSAQKVVESGSYRDVYLAADTIKSLAPETAQGPMLDLMLEGAKQRATIRELGSNLAARARDGLPIIDMPAPPAYHYPLALKNGYGDEIVSLPKLDLIAEQDPRKMAHKQSIFAEVWLRLGRPYSDVLGNSAEFFYHVDQFANGKMDVPFAFSRDTKVIPTEQQTLRAFVEAYADHQLAKVLNSPYPSSIEDTYRALDELYKKAGYKGANDRLRQAGINTHLFWLAHIDEKMAYISDPKNEARHSGMKGIAALLAWNELEKSLPHSGLSTYWLILGAGLMRGLRGDKPGSYTINNFRNMGNNSRAPVVDAYRALTFVLQQAGYGEDRLQEGWNALEARVEQLSHLREQSLLSSVLKSIEQAEQNLADLLTASEDALKSSPQSMEDTIRDLTSAMEDLQNVPLTLKQQGLTSIDYEAAYAHNGTDIHNAAEQAIQNFENKLGDVSSHFQLNICKLDLRAIGEASKRSFMQAASELAKKAVQETVLATDKFLATAYADEVMDVSTPGYPIFTTAHDEVVPASSLLGQEEAETMAVQLNRFRSDVKPLGIKLNNTLSISEEKAKDTAVTLLLDCSGSSRGAPIARAVLATEVIASVLESKGVKVEILGFTTSAWKGGINREEWLVAGKPAAPGRLCPLRHVVIKPATRTVQDARNSLAICANDKLLKENVDGEALLWASRRLLSRPEQDRVLIQIGDATPIDDSTLITNPSDILNKHRDQALAQIESLGIRVALLATEEHQTGDNAFDNLPYTNKVGTDGFILNAPWGKADEIARFVADMVTNAPMTTRPLVSSAKQQSHSPQMV